MAPPGDVLSLTTPTAIGGHGVELQQQTSNKGVKQDILISPTIYLHDGAEHPPGKTPVSLAEAFTDPNGTLEPQQRATRSTLSGRPAYMAARTCPDDPSGCTGQQKLGPVRVALPSDGLIAVLPAWIRFTSADDRRALHLESNQHHR